MRGRGLLIAAAVLQLVAATLLLASAGSLVVMAAFGHQSRPTAFAGSGVVAAAVSLAFFLASIGLLRRRRTAWVASLALCGSGALLYAGFALALRDASLALFVAPFVVIGGLLLGGRHAVFTPGRKTAAGPNVVTPFRGA